MSLGSAGKQRKTKLRSLRTTRNELLKMKDRRIIEQNQRVLQNRAKQNQRVQQEQASKTVRVLVYVR